MKLFKSFAVGAAVTVVILSGSSCITSPVCLTSSTTHIQERTTLQSLGQTDGSSRAWSIMGLWMIGRPDIASAIDEAVRKKDADALVGVRCYETYRWYLFFSTTTVRVEGEAVKYSRSK
ncbi:MAG: hypothetical protein JXA20_10830 [Spirochaetes bacterium]|nr:hypothetical protein [Spirochaetota bacterium]